MPYIISPVRMRLTNLAANTTLSAQFNPTQFEESLGANYAKLSVPGLSHQVLQYSYTENVTYSLELFNNAIGGGPDGWQRIMDARTFLYAAVHPQADVSGIRKAGAPRILFTWPEMISLTCVITKLAFSYTQFDYMGRPMAYTAKVDLEEVRDSFVSMTDIYAAGTQRSSAALGAARGD